MRVGSSLNATRGPRTASDRGISRLSRPRRVLVGAMIVLTLLAAAFTTLVEAGSGTTAASRSVEPPLLG